MAKKKFRYEVGDYLISGKKELYEVLEVLRTIDKQGFDGYKIKHLASQKTLSRNKNVVETLTTKVNKETAMVLYGPK